MAPHTRTWPPNTQTNLTDTSIKPPDTQTLLPHMRKTLLYKQSTSPHMRTEHPHTRTKSLCWICVGHVWRMSLTCAGYVLDICWTCVRHVFDMCWICFGYMLDMCLACVRHVLDKFGTIWNICWDKCQAHEQAKIYNINKWSHCKESVGSRGTPGLMGISINIQNIPQICLINSIETQKNLIRVSLKKHPYREFPI